MLRFPSGFRALTHSGRMARRGEASVTLMVALTATVHSQMSTEGFMRYVASLVGTHHCV